jgi:hypothetical protein
LGVRRAAVAVQEPIRLDLELARERGQRGSRYPGPLLVTLERAFPDAGTLGELRLFEAGARAGRAQPLAERRRVE